MALLKKFNEFYIEELTGYDTCEFTEYTLGIMKNFLELDNFITTIFVEDENVLYWTKSMENYSIFHLPQTQFYIYKGGSDFEDQEWANCFGLDPWFMNPVVLYYTQSNNWHPKDRAMGREKLRSHALLDLIATSTVSEEVANRLMREPNLNNSLGLKLLKSHLLTPKFKASHESNYDCYDLIEDFKVLFPKFTFSEDMIFSFESQTQRNEDAWSPILTQCLDGSVDAMQGVLFSNLLNLPFSQSGQANVFEQFMARYESQLTKLSKMNLNKIYDLINTPHSQLFDLKINIDFSSLRSCIEDILKTVCASVSSVIELVKESIICLVICLVIGFCICFSAFKGTSVAIGICLAILALYLRKDIASNVRSVIESQTETIPESQSCGISSFACLFKIFSLVVFKAPSLSKLDKVMKTISNLPRFISGVETVSNLIITAFQYAEKYFYKYVLKTEVPITEISPLATFMKNVIELYDRYNKGVLIYDDINYNVVMSHYKEGNSLLASPMFKNETHNVVRTLNLLQTIITEFRNRGFTHSSVRNPPVVIYMSGDTGLGKSTISYPLAVDILKRISTDVKDLKQNWRKCIYTRNCEQEFWDGYTGQLVCVYDDYSQRKDTAGNPNPELFEIVRCANNFPYPLHMANLNDKQNTFFSSKVLLCTSNITPNNLKPESLNYSDALLRRFDLNIEIKLKSDVTPQMLHRKTQFDPTVYLFDLYDIKQNFIRTLTYDELVDEVVSIYNTRAGFVDSIAQYIESRFEVPESQCLSDVLQKIPLVGNIFTPRDVFYEAVEADEETIERHNRLLEERRKNESLYNTVKENLKYESQKWKEQWQHIVANYPFIRYIKVAALITGLLAAGLGISSLFLAKKEHKNRVTFIESDCIEVESGEKVATRQQLRAESAEKVQVRPKVKTESQDSRPETILVDGQPIDQVPESQGVYDVNASEILGKVLKKNLYGMYLGKTRLGHGIFIKGNVIMYPTHFKPVIEKQIKEDSTSVLSFKSPFVNRPVWTMFAKDFILESKSFTNNSFTTDISMCSIKEAWTHCDLTSSFVSKDEVSSIIGSPAMMPLVMCDSVHDNPFAIIKFTDAQSALRLKEDLSIRDPTDTVIKLRSGWEYQLDTVKGDCGAPLILRNPRVKGKICGMHIAGLSDGRGYSSPITQEFINKALKQFDPEDLTTIVYRTEIESQCGVDMSWFNGKPFVLDDNLSIPGEFARLGKARAIPSPSKSQIVPSVVHNKITEAKTKTSLLFPAKIDGELWNPMHYRMMKYGRKNSPIDHDLINSSYLALKQDLTSLIRKKLPNLNEYKSCYDFETAMKGIDGEETINSIKRKSSPGFPWVFKTKGVGKRDFFGEDGDFDFSSPLCQELKQEVDLIIDDAKKGIRHTHVFTDLLKDERKPAHKFKNTRAFSGCPLEYLAVCKMYFQGAVSILTKLKNESHISVGTNVYSRDWDFMVRYLRRYSDNAVAGDFEGFDSSQMVYILRRAGKILNDISKLLPDYDPEHDKIRDVLLQSLWHSVHLNGSDVVMWGHALPSGHYLTAIINSIYVSLLFSSAFVLANEEENRKNGMYLGRKILACKFFQDCGLVAYGDDHICSVPDKYLSFFNQYTLESLFAKLGIGYTSEDKEDFSAPYRHFTEVSYLKRKIVLDESRQRYVAPLTLDTVLETPMWIHRSDDPVEAMKCNMEFSLRELSLHDEETWNRWAPKMHELLQDHGCTTIFLDYQDTRAFVLDPELNA
nr:MAG: nonstructural polyprotein [Dicistroviridae sp.]